MLDLSWSELLVIAVVAIVFIGPKELPGLLRTLGQMANKARGLAREFQNNVDDMIRESELDEIRKQVQNVQSGSIEQAIEKAVDPKGDIRKALSAPDLSDPFAMVSAPKSATPTAAESAAADPTALPPAPAAPASAGPAPAAAAETAKPAA